MAHAAYCFNRPTSAGRLFNERRMYFQRSLYVHPASAGNGI